MLNQLIHPRCFYTASHHPWVFTVSLVCSLCLLLSLGGSLRHRAYLAACWAPSRPTSEGGLWEVLLMLCFCAAKPGQEASHSPSPVLVLPGAAGGFSTHQAQALGIIHSDKHISGENSRDKCVSSQNLGQILPLHLGRFNLQISVRFLTVFLLKPIKTIHTLNVSRVKIQHGEGFWIFEARWFSVGMERPWGGRKFCSPSQRV